MISIIIPVYNQAAKLSTTLASIYRQQCRDWEVIIVNDGSTDDPESVFTKFIKDKNIENNFLFINQSNQGAPAARNRGAQEAAGDYLFFCDADANLRPEALATLLEVLQSETNASFAFSSFMWGSKMFKVGPFDINRLRSEPYIHTMSLIKRADFPAGGWDQNIKKFQDWDLWLTMVAAGKKGVWVNQVLFTITPGGTISSWLPAFAYKLFPFLPQVKKYRAAMAVIKQKHDLV